MAILRAARNARSGSGSIRMPLHSTGNGTVIKAFLARDLATLEEHLHIAGRAIARSARPAFRRTWQPIRQPVHDC